MKTAPRAPELTPAMRPLGAFAALADPALETIIARIADLRRRNDVEDVHQLRVAVRHLRAMVWSFRPALPGNVATRWNDALRELADMAGEVRDWDVFATETLKPALDMQPGDPVLTALTRTALTRRRLARAILLARLAEYQHWPLPTLFRDLSHVAARAAGSHGRLRKFARKRIRDARENVRERAREARDGDPTHVHRLRIGSKRLRYAIEALAPVLPGRFRKRLHKKLVKRQDKLGRVVDETVARRLMSECLSMSEEPPLQP